MNYLDSFVNLLTEKSTSYYNLDAMPRETNEKTTQTKAKLKSQAKAPENNVLIDFSNTIKQSMQKNLVSI